MTATSDCLTSTNASDKTQHYERLRARVLDAHGHPQLTAISAAVLMRQGLSTWMQLDDTQGIEECRRDDRTQPRSSLPTHEHSELLRVLTSLVFNVCKRKESA